MSTESRAEIALGWIKAFNRKERYHLLKQALGKKFGLDKGFREEIASELNIDVPEDAYVAMDYHLDWIAAALVLAQDNVNNPNILQDYEPNNKLGATDAMVLTGNQEDTDLLVTFIDHKTERLVLILIEAKYDTGWSGKQFESKGHRLGQIFASGQFSFAKPYFVLAWPIKESSEGRKVPGFKSIVPCPDWFFKNDDRVNENLYCLNLKLPDTDLYQPTRIQKSQGRYKNWKVSRAMGSSSETSE